MSITSELKNPHSAASLWLDANFDMFYVSAGLGAQADGADTIRPGGDLKDYPWPTVGSAVEFRLRQACGVRYYDTTAAFGGLGSFSDGMFHDALALLWHEHALEEATSRVNAWVLYFAGVCEGIYRSGRAEELARYREVLGAMERSGAWAAFRIQMDQLRQGVLESVDSGRHPCLGQVIGEMAVPETVIEDIARVCDAAIGSANFGVIRRSGDFVDSPVFAGGAWVGGADGDFLVGHTLFDVKTTIHPEKLWRDGARQLVAYVALDTEDSYQIDQLAVLLPRQHGAVARAGLDEILFHSSFDSRAEMQASARLALDPEWSWRLG